MTPEERNVELVGLAGAGTLQQALHRDARRRRDMLRDFEPIVRPHLSDIDATPRARVAGGREVRSGDTVAVDTGHGRVDGVVVAVMGGEVQARGDDGLTLWYVGERVH